VIAVSTRTGSGVDTLRAAIVDVVAGLPDPEPAAAVRIWVDRLFTIVGAGTVVTGTLPAGTIRVGDVLATIDNAEVRIRGLEALGHPIDEAHGVSRVALRLGGNPPKGIGRGTPLFDPARWQVTDVADIRVDEAPEALPERPMLHIGAASLTIRVRGLERDLARIRLERPLPLHVGDRLVIRDPGSRMMWGATVLDPAPPPLNRRGSAKQRAEALAATTGVPDIADELRRRTVAHAGMLSRLGIEVDSDLARASALRKGDWLLGRNQTHPLSDQLLKLLAKHASDHPLDPTVPLATAARWLDLPSPDLVRLLVDRPVAIVDGRIVDERATLPVPVREAVRQLAEDLADKPFAAPGAERLSELGIEPRAVAAAARAGLLLRLSEQIVLMPGVEEIALDRLRGLPQPFTTSQARICLDTSRRVVIPLLEHLDALHLTRRLPDDRREIVSEASHA
jgi:selenocysteine-specific elongation factor